MILLDVSRMLWRGWRGQLPTGIDRACHAYVRHFGARACAVVQRGGMTLVLDAAHSQRLFALLLEQPQDFRARLARLMARAVWVGRLNGAALNGALYLNVGHTGLDRPGHARWVRRNDVRAIYLVHDLIPITHPQFARGGEPERHAARMRAVVEVGGGVIANSQDSLDALARFSEVQASRVPPSLVAPLGVEALRKGTCASAPLPEPYFVVLGTIEGRKNHALLLRVWRGLAEHMGEATPRLVIIGQRGWQAEGIFRLLDTDDLLRRHVMELGRCDDTALANWLAHARALLFPSFAEGQGLPLIEALSAGAPVIANDLGVFRETADAITELLGPEDDAAWERAIRDYAQPHSPARARQLERMRGFAPPTWEAHFATVESWLGTL